MRINSSVFQTALLLLLLNACSMPARLGQAAKKELLTHPALSPAHVGISIMDAGTGQYLYNFQGDKYFIPASNTKLFTCLAALQSLEDSLVAFRYVDKGNNTIELEANGDPTFLHPDFTDQPAFRFLQQQQRILLTNANWKDAPLGAGWAWDDYTSDYMAERSFLPLYGNVTSFRLNNGSLSSMPHRFAAKIQSASLPVTGRFSLTRSLGSDSFYVVPAARSFTTASLPFQTKGLANVAQLLSDTLHRLVEPTDFTLERWPDVVKVHSQPTDSALSLMMHRSDNFFAEQLLLMVSNEKLALMNSRRIIDTLLNNEWRDIPQRPKWVDGSGLSRYNLFTPQDFIWLLQRMKNQYDWKRITAILPTGNEGTLAGLYKTYAGRIYAKTGTLSNHVALSGYLLTNRNRTLIFSVLVNAHQTTPGEIRKQIEKFLTGIIEKY